MPAEVTTYRFVRGALIGLEAALLGLLAVFWILQTIDLDHPGASLRLGNL